MPKNTKKVDIKKRRRLSKFVFNMYIESGKKINDDLIDTEIQDNYENFFEVNKVKRPEDLVDGSIKSIEPELIKISDYKYQFVINVSAYTVLRFNYSNFAKHLNKKLKLPVGALKVTQTNKLPKGEEAEVEPDEEIEEEQIEEIKQEPEKVIEPPKENPELIKQIDEQIHNDETIPIKVPQEYVEAMETIPQGKSCFGNTMFIQKNKERD
jgi:hypothetical protein